jgi:hypothetical protein
MTMKRSKQLATGASHNTSQIGNKSQERERERERERESVCVISQGTHCNKIVEYRSGVVRLTTEEVRKTLII